METSPAVIATGKRLGKLPPKFDKRTLRLADYVRARVALPKVPDRFDLTKIKGLKAVTYPMFANNRLGDCTAAGLGHMEQTTSRGKKAPTEAQVIAFYSRVTGYDPATGVHDDGAYLLDCLNAATKPEYELDPGNPIGPFVAIDPMRDDLVRFALWAFGGAYLGANMPITAQTQDKVWSYIPATNGNEPGSWGGHAFNLLPKATKTKTTCVTWGTLVTIEEEWRHRYNDEVFAYLDADWIATAHGGKVHGLDMAGLLSDLASIKR